MSANNCTLIKSHKGKYLVFTNVMAESWDEVNVLEKPKWECNDLENAMKYAILEEKKDRTEYGINFDTLPKDDGEVVIK